MLEDIKWFGNGSKNFLSALNNWGRNNGEAFFPARHDKTIVRHSSGEKTSEWFQRIVDDQFNGDPGACKIDAGIAAICRISWQNKIVSELSLQTLVAKGGDIEDLYLGEDIEHDYFRLDIDPFISGKMFKEPYPHVHFRGKGGPRYPVNGLCDGNPLVGFVDFIYRNYKFETWLEWARFVWNRNAQEAGGPNDYFENAARAFESNQIKMIEGPYKNTIVRLKAYLSQERLKMSEIRMNNERIRLFSYISLE
jgi:hypothetical protein